MCVYGYMPHLLGYFADIRWSLTYLAWKLSGESLLIQKGKPARQGVWIEACQILRMRWLKQTIQYEWSGSRLIRVLQVIRRDTLKNQLSFGLCFQYCEIIHAIHWIDVPFDRIFCAFVNTFRSWFWSEFLNSLQFSFDRAFFLLNLSLFYPDSQRPENSKLGFFISNWLKNAVLIAFSVCEW